MEGAVLVEDGEEGRVGGGREGEERGGDRGEQPELAEEGGNEMEGRSIRWDLHLPLPQLVAEGKNCRGHNIIHNISKN
jgi:hypothetical protein